MSKLARYLKRLRTSRAARRDFFTISILLIIAAILIVFSIFPILWMISASLSPTGTLATQSLIPKNPGFGNYLTLVKMDQFPFWSWLLNSIKIASITSVTSLAITTMAGYAFSRFRFRGSQTMLKAILLINTFPGLLALVATFLMVSQIGDVLQYKGQDVVGLDNHFTLILVYLGGSMGINIWLMKGYLDTIPRDIDESAMVEGASNWQIFTRLILPLLRPILVVIAIINFIGTYGEFVLARVLLRSNETYTLMVGLQIFAGAQFQQRWGVFAAGALMGALPIIIIYLVLQDQIVSGLTQGAVKG